jgi:hypothetical protein
MHFTIAAVAAALVAGVSAAGYANGTVYTTEVVTAYTTYCPAATSLVYGNYTYTVTEVCLPPRNSHKRLLCAKIGFPQLFAQRAAWWQQALGSFTKLNRVLLTSESY